jgi:hypothetical protein
MRFEQAALVGNSPDLPLHSMAYRDSIGLERLERLLFPSVLDGNHTAGIERHGTG